MKLGTAGYPISSMVLPQDASELLSTLARSCETGIAFRAEAMAAIAALPGYNWSGIYRLEGEDLVLDQFVGAETEHTRIRVGVGVCGTAVATNENQIVDDVRELENYLSCSLQTRSEIVVLIRRDGNVLGQIDIDGHEIGAFDASDERLLEGLADLIAQRW